MTLRSFARCCATCVVIGFALSFTCGRALAVQVTSGVSFYQVNYEWDAAFETNSDTGQVEMDQSDLLSATGIAAGYLNVVTTDGWVLQNVPVFNSSDVASNMLLTTDDDIDQTSLTAYVDYSATPLTAAPSGTASVWSVGNVDYEGEGDGIGGPAGDPASPAPNSLTFNPIGQNIVNYQFNHPNEQTANNQCAPMATANNIEWLRTTYGVNFSGSHTLGLGPDNDGTFVGQLDQTMARSGLVAGDRTLGNGTGRLSQVQGVLQFLANQSHSLFKVKHQGTNGGANISQAGMTSTGSGASLTFQFILDELTAGSALQGSFTYPGGGGHAIEIVGAGRVLDVPFLWYKSDHDQSDTDVFDFFGTDELDFSFLDSNFNLVNEKNVPQLQFLISVAVPEPSTLLLAMMAFAAIVGSVRNRRALRGFD